MVNVEVPWYMHLEVYMAETRIREASPQHHHKDTQFSTARLYSQHRGRQGTQRKKKKRAGGHPGAWATPRLLETWGRGVIH